MMLPTRVPKSTCPDCGHCFDRMVDATGDATPQPGDITLCIRCGAVLRLTAQMLVEKLPEEELAQLSIGQRIQIARIQEQLRRLHAEQN